MLHSKSLSRADVTTLAALVIIVLLLVPTVFGQALDRARELSNRTLCASNLRGLAQSMLVYAADNSDNFPAYPLPTSATAYTVTFKTDEAGNKVDAVIAGLYKDAPYAGNPSAGLWLLVLDGSAAPRQFICRSDPFGNAIPKLSTNSQADTGLPAKGADPGNYYRNFQSQKNISYSSAYPWTLDKNGKVTFSSVWRNTTDASLAILSDMAPYLGAKADAATRPANADPKSPPDPDWAVKKANSQNHLFDGQNVAFADSHVEFARSPTIGQANDSIWGIWKSKEAQPKDLTEEPIEAGTLPHAPSGTSGMSDVVMVPTRDSKGDVK